MNRKTKKIVKNDFLTSYKTRVTVNDILEKTDFFDNKNFVNNKNNPWKIFSICSSIVCIFLLVFIFTRFSKISNNKIFLNSAYISNSQNVNIDDIKVCKIELDQNTTIDIFKTIYKDEVSYYYVINGDTSNILMLVNDVNVEINKQGKIATVNENDIIKLNIKNEEGEIQYYIGE